ncbi:hypothetical protein [Actinophytocola xanthii]|uniref:hypothetical protein n=1 Tax=Actinophytocola xanthii TaxID=1912961 RepID=UPI00117846C5|nr:hypothetical protein [Actinophytocola xanthii]
MPSAPSKRLIGALVEHGRVDEVVEVLLRPTGWDESTSRWEHFAMCMTERGRSAELLTLLPRLRAADIDSFVARTQIDTLLADQLARENRWAEVLELLKHTSGWADTWLPRQLGRLGLTDQLRRLADTGNQTARQELVELLLAKGPVNDAVTVLRGLVEEDSAQTPDRWAPTTLAEQLSDQGDLAELGTRIATGDSFAAAVLADRACQGRVPNADQILTAGLSPDGSFPTG